MKTRGGGGIKARSQEERGKQAGQHAVPFQDISGWTRVFISILKRQFIHIKTWTSWCFSTSHLQRPGSFPSCDFFFWDMCFPRPHIICVCRLIHFGRFIKSSVFVIEETKVLSLTYYIQRAGWVNTSRAESWRMKMKWGQRTMMKELWNAQRKEDGGLM